MVVLVFVWFYILLRIFMKDHVAEMEDCVRALYEVAVFVASIVVSICFIVSI